MWLIFLLLLFLVVIFYSKWVSKIRSKEKGIKFLQNNVALIDKKRMSEIPKNSIDNTDSGKSRK